MPVQLSLDVKNTHNRGEKPLPTVRIGSMDERNVNETIVPKLTNDRQKNVMLLQQRGPDDMFDGALDEAAPCSYNVSVKSDFVVGLGKNI